ncbi:hypothetical protein Tco_1552041, partial [Tanacetum coccineum]
MVAFLEKSTGSAGFHQIIDFLNRSHICYALTKKPEVCVSFIKQFWRSAEASTDDNGEVKINATIDGHSLSITEEIFEQLALMGYHTGSVSDRIGVLEADLTKTKKTYSSAYTKLILRVKKLKSQIKIGKARRQARVVLSDDEVFEDDSSKQGRKFSDEGVQEKASTDTEIFIQEVIPTEVIQDQEDSEKASDEISTAGAKKGTASEEVPIVST